MDTVGGAAGGSGMRRESVEVMSRPGSPNEERQDMSSRPSGIMVPGACVTGNVGMNVGLIICTYCRTSCGCMSAFAPANRSMPASGSWTCQPSAQSKCIRSNHKASWVRFWM